jgi:hypothetical protein
MEVRYILLFALSVLSLFKVMWYSDQRKGVNVAVIKKNSTYYIVTLFSAAITEYHRVEIYKEKKLTFQSSRGWKSNIKVRVPSGGVLLAVS